MIRCCIFDLDGTLLNTLDALTYTTNLTLKEFGYGPVDPEHIKQFVGDGYRMQMKRALMYSGDKELLMKRHFLPTPDCLRSIVFTMCGLMREFLSCFRN